VQLLEERHTRPDGARVVAAAAVGATPEANRAVAAAAGQRSTVWRPGDAPHHVLRQAGTQRRPAACGRRGTTGTTRLVAAQRCDGLQARSGFALHMHVTGYAAHNIFKDNDILHTIKLTLHSMFDPAADR